MVAGADEIGLHGEDHPAADRVEGVGFEPVAVGLDRLGQGLVEELQGQGVGRFKLQDALDGDVAQLPGVHG